MVTAPRRYYDEKEDKWYFSVVDIIALTTSSTNPQNYWKVLKNRLKRDGNEVVTKFNRLKMKARDGKFYLTDAADQETITEVIKLIPGARVNELASCFAPFIEHPTSKPPTPVLSLLPASHVTPSPDSEPEAELLIDAYESGNYFFIEAFVAGVSLPDLNIEVSSTKIKISGKRNPPLPARPAGGLGEEGRPGGDYFTQDLQG